MANVLAADDDQYWLHQVVSVCKMLGHHVSASQDPTTVKVQLRYAERNGNVDLLITDYHMPGLPGEDLARQAKQAGIPVIMQTGAAIRNREAPVYVDVVLIKPWSQEDLMQAIEIALSKRETPDANG